jgi:hypothetical protein
VMLLEPVQPVGLLPSVATGLGRAGLGSSSLYQTRLGPDVDDFTPENSMLPYR